LKEVNAANVKALMAKDKEILHLQTTAAFQNHYEAELHLKNAALFISDHRRRRCKN
jgi:hypothetical protein